MAETPVRSYRLGPHYRHLLNKLMTKRQESETAVVREAIRLLALREDIKAPEPLREGK